TRGWASSERRRHHVQMQSEDQGTTTGRGRAIVVEMLRVTTKRSVMILLASVLAPACGGQARDSGQRHNPSEASSGTGGSGDTITPATGGATVVAPPAGGVTFGNGGVVTGTGGMTSSAGAFAARDAGSAGGSVSGAGGSVTGGAGGMGPTDLAPCSCVDPTTP